MSEENVAPVESNCIPPKKFERNEYGLICDGSVEYVYNEDATINWRKMIKPEFLVPHRRYFEERGLPVPATVEGLDDKQVLILLGGLKELAQTRGYVSVQYPTVVAPNENYVAAVCTIVWQPNYETYGQAVEFSAMADATPVNAASPIARTYLAATAENRAFCRAIRNFLKIHIVSVDEIGANTEGAVTKASTSLLNEVMAKYNISFDIIKNKLVEEGFEGAKGFGTVDDIPVFKQLELLERINRKAKEAADKAAVTTE